MKEDSELSHLRDLMPAPTSWEDGFGIKAMIGGLFVGMIMTPASMYMDLVVGGSTMGPAAQWVTLILFIEVARRAFTTLSRPEVYVLYYMAGASMTGTLMGSINPLWNQFLVQSESFRQFGLTEHIPTWVAPHNPDVLGTRSLLHIEWLAPLGLIALAQFIQRVDHFGLGYVMYRITSDVEKLPFPMAPVYAQGVTALADASNGQDTWRWRVFSFGAMLGMAFAAVYLALPSITSALLGESLAIFPLPFKDLTGNTESFLPAVPMLLSFNLGFLLAGMVLPFWAMVGSFIGLCVMIAANPLLHHFGVLHSWAPGLGAITTIQANTLDFYFSFGLGLTAAVAVIGIVHVFGSFLKARRNEDSTEQQHVDWRRLFNPPAGRGDISIWAGLAVYVAVTCLTITTAWLLLSHAHRTNPAGAGPVTWTLLGVFAFYGFVYTPIVSYVWARMEGIVGLSVPLPFVREATMILTGYKGAAIWFAPFPNHNYGNQTLYFRTTELSGTKIWSMVKAEAFIFPIVLISTVVFSQLIWKIAPVPSSAFPYADKLWELTAYRQGLMYSATLPGGAHGPFAEAFSVTFLLCGLGAALGAYALLSFFGLPVLLVYGLIRGLDQSTPDVILPQFLGALLGRYYFARKFGSNWGQYRVVFFAGYGCGVGLVMMFTLGIVFMSKAVFQSPY